MGMFVITDPAAGVIFGTVEAADGAEAAGLIHYGKARWFGPDNPEPQALYTAGKLADGRWRELAPVGPGMAGQCGGDVQITEAWSRRFALIRPDNTWAVITYTWYGINETTGYVDESTMPEVVEQQIEFLIVEDPHDLDRNLSWDDDFTKEYEPDPSEEGVKAHAATFTIADIDWNGES
jgi:hypothetical protein